MKRKGQDLRIGFFCLVINSRGENFEGKDLKELTPSNFLEAISILCPPKQTSKIPLIIPSLPSHSLHFLSLLKSYPIPALVHFLFVY